MKKQTKELSKMSNENAWYSAVFGQPKGCIYRWTSYQEVKSEAKMSLRPSSGWLQGKFLILRISVLVDRD